MEMETWVYELKPYALLAIGISALNFSQDKSGIVWAIALIGLTAAIIYQRVDHRIATRRV
ncbi:MAG: hypothetical protein CL677_02765 [Bdellovibrionaceae bacterium]|nr:hypothetical protein [Pseudobdellovibrionaceae bacterium]|tara:strand:+ start:348 stop:527 length:180 start_codon:yes stop_codon:yes gene_type:complete